MPVKCVSNIKLNLNKMQPQQKNMTYPELTNNPQTCPQSFKNITCYVQCPFPLHQCFLTCNKNSLKNVAWQDVIKTKCKINCVRKAVTRSPSFNSILEITKSDAWQGPRQLTWLFNRILPLISFKLFSFNVVPLLTRSTIASATPIWIYSKDK